MRSDQRRQRFLLGQGRGSTTGEDSLFELAGLLLVKDGGMQWNSTHQMMLRAVQLKDANTKFQEEPIDGSARDYAYSLSKDPLRRL